MHRLVNEYFPIFELIYKLNKDQAYRYLKKKLFFILKIMILIRNPRNPTVSILNVMGSFLSVKSKRFTKSLKI